MSFQPSSNITEQIADHLAWEIVSGRLSDRERIQELKLARQLGVSRGSVREALLLLQGRQLVDLVPRRGAAVKAIQGRELQRFATLYGDLLARGLSAVRGYPAEQQMACLEPICLAAKAEDAEAVVRGRDEFLRGALEHCDDAFLLGALVPLQIAANRIGVRAAAHRDHDLRDSFRWCSGLHQAMGERDAGRVSELVSAFLRRECQLASESMG